MARFSAGLRTTGAGSTTLPIASIYASANGGGALREVGIFNTTTTAVALRLVRLSSTGTQGSAQTEQCHDDNVPATAECTVYDTHSSTGPTIAGDLGYRTPLGAAIGAGILWTFGDTGIRIAKGTTNGIGVIVATGTGQICDVYFAWDE